MQTQTKRTQRTREAPAMKVVKYDLVGAFFNHGGDELASFLQGRLAVELLDGSQWACVCVRHHSPFKPKHRFQRPYRDSINCHCDRRHRSWYIKLDHDEPMMMVRVGKEDMSRMFCHRCGWLDPATDPEITGRADV